VWEKHDWKCWVPLDETDRASLPLSIFNDGDTAPIGLDVALTKATTGSVHWPILIVYTTDGTLICFSVIDTEYEEKGCAVVKDAQAIPSVDENLTPSKYATVKVEVINEYVDQTKNEEEEEKEAAPAKTPAKVTEFAVPKPPAQRQANTSGGSSTPSKPEVTVDKGKTPAKVTEFAVPKPPAQRQANHPAVVEPTKPLTSAKPVASLDKGKAPAKAPEVKSTSVKAPTAKPQVKEKSEEEILIEVSQAYK
jgi:hypothetical protein